MKHKFLTAMTFSLIMLTLMPVIFEATYAVSPRIVVVGSIDPSLGYDEIVNGTTTFLVARSPPVYKRTFYHNWLRIRMMYQRVARVLVG